MGTYLCDARAGTLMGNSDLNFTNTDAADTFVLVAGNFFLIVLLLYPLEVVRPGWLSLKRAGILLFPYAALSLLYYAGLYLLGQEPLLLRDTGQFMEHIGEFNVWYRLLMIVSIVLYLAFLFRLTWHYKEVYRQWCRDNYSDDKDMDISWLRRYGIGVVLIGAAVEGYLFGRLNPVLRVISFGAAMMLIDSGAITDLIGIGGLFVIILFQKFVAANRNGKSTAA